MESAVLFFFVALLAGAFVLYETYFTYRAYLRLSHFDGPKWAPFSRLWLLRNHASGRQPAGLADVCNKYGNFYTAEPKGFYIVALIVYHCRPYCTGRAEPPCDFGPPRLSSNHRGSV